MNLQHFTSAVLSMNKLKSKVYSHSHEWLILQIEQTRTPPNGIWDGAPGLKLK